MLLDFHIGFSAIARSKVVTQSYCCCALCPLCREVQLTASSEDKLVSYSSASMHSGGRYMFAESPENLNVLGTNRGPKDRVMIMMVQSVGVPFLKE